MAEASVPFPYHPDDVVAIRRSFSEPRFGSYLVKGGHEVDYAFALYLYNARLAKAFLFPLSVVEVTLRNSIDESLSIEYGPQWPYNPKFQNYLSPKGLATLQKAMTRAGGGASRGQIVAELTFDFWSNFLRPEYGMFWRQSLRRVFPNATREWGRHEIQGLAKAINHVRNRVAHYEPVLDLNGPEIQGKIHQLISLRCSHTALWTRHHSTIGSVLRTRPRKGQATLVALASKLAPDFVTAEVSSPLKDVICQIGGLKQSVVYVDADGRAVGAFSALDVTRFIGSDLAKNADLFDANEKTVAHLIAEIDLANSFEILHRNVPLATAVTHLKGKHVRIVVGIDDDGRPVGTILRAHRRY